MPNEQQTKVQLLVRRVFRFDTHQETANLVARIDTNTSLKQAFGDTFYRLSLEQCGVFYCVIFHSPSLVAEYQQVIGKYATECGGAVVTDETVKQTLSAYALVRYLRNSGEPVRWDDPIPKPS